MGGSGGLFGSQQTTLQPPTPVSTVPGAQGLGQALVNYFQNILSGQNARTPYMGYQSVYGGPNNTFPSTSFYGTPVNTSTAGAGTPTAASIQQAINQAVASAFAQQSGTGAGSVLSNRDAGGGKS